MPKAHHGTGRGRGLPAEDSILAEASLTPARPEAFDGTRTTYRILRTSEVDAYDAPLAPAEFADFGAARFAEAGDAFGGKARKAAKLVVSAAETEAFEDLKNLIPTLPAEGEMEERHGAAFRADNGLARVEEEERNVKVNAFLYAASRESDNDFHLIIGRDPKRSTALYMTVEISGLPPKRSRHFRRLKEARDAYQAFFGDSLPGASYDFYDPPIPVEVEGSLFCDMSHMHGQRPGPKSLRDDIPTIWEIHPVSAIRFEP